MPPKRSSARRSGSTPQPVGTDAYFRDFSSPETNSPALPDVPIKHSFAYGSSLIPIVPRELSEKPNLDLSDMAKQIDVGIEAANERESSKDLEDESEEEVRRVTRSRSRTSKSGSPIRKRRLRDPTPDQVQLLDSLREASPVKSNHSPPGRSTPTPPPPVPRTLSPTPSAVLQPPTLQHLTQDSQIYPSPLARFGHRQPNQSPLGSSPQAKSIDNESTVSFSVERDIHEDSLQRTHNHRRKPRGKNITAPPRRPSGLAFPQETIEEEDEESIAGSSPKPERPPSSQGEHKPSLEPQPEPEPEPDPMSAPTRTIIPNTIRPKDSSRRSPSIIEEPVNPEDRLASKLSSSLRKLPAIHLIFAVFIMAVSVVAVYSTNASLSGISHRVSSCLSFGGRQPYLPLNATGMDAVNALNNQMMKLTAQVTSLSKDMKIIRSDVDNVAAQQIEASPIRVHRERPKINFLSIGLGAIVDPWLSSPTIGKRLSRTAKFYYTVAEWVGFAERPRAPQHPTAALAPWEDIGDCWCSAPRAGMSQLSVLLGRGIVPEEVVVEHMPEGAALDIGVAPREMELWARFKVVDDNKPSKRQSSWFGSDEFSTDLEGVKYPGQLTLSETIMSTLSLAYPSDPEGSYSDDELLGPDFYRLGKFIYDPHGPDHIQSFMLDAIIDYPSIRVDKVVLRVKSNWGSEHTCLYRVKLHGHV
ncbi:hypothetical protein PHISCL_04811 [Aspergillus sclerotialis]|uniref:SUN domain-containing protein n=1 Tax=Aspergillus sclerotialis TaxID=2070753 RepID=A0A3A2ZII4_9EURO|nr:hypothetical protein PHISCL_04811 [Aspergillus sclerotialis]